MLETLHGGLDLGELLLPGAGIVLQYFVDPVLEKYFLKRGVVPFGLDFFQAYRKLSAHQLLGALGVVAQNVVHSQELRLLVLDHTGVGGQAYLAVGAGVESIDGLVRRRVVVELDDYLGVLGRIVVYLAYLDLALVVGLKYGVNEVSCGGSVGNLGDDKGILVDFLNIGADPYPASAQAPVVGRCVGVAAGGEVGLEIELLFLEYGYGRVYELIEVVRQDLAGQTDSDALGALGQQQRELDRQVDRLLVAAVVGVDPLGELGIEQYLVGERSQAGLDVPACSRRVSGEDIAPVTLTVDEQVFLSELDEGVLDGGITVGMVLHGFSDQTGHLVLAAVVHDLHHVENPSLHRFQTVLDMRNGSLQYDVGGIVQSRYMPESLYFFVPSDMTLSNLPEPEESSPVSSTTASSISSSSLLILNFIFQLAKILKISDTIL